MEPIVLAFLWLLVFVSALVANWLVVFFGGHRAIAAVIAATIFVVAFTVWVNFPVGLLELARFTTRPQ
jgi:hypothetical protein